MAFTVADFEDLYRLLSERPEWRARLRPLILGDEFEQVPSRLDRIEQWLGEIAEQQATFATNMAAFERRQAAFETNMAAFERRQAAFETNMAAFERRQTAFEERMDRFDVRLAEISEQIAGLITAAQVHALRMNRIEGRMGNIEGQLLEQRYGMNLNAGFGKYLRRAEIVQYLDLDRLMEAVERGDVTEEQIWRIANLDFLVQGRSRTDGEPLLLAVEVSQTIEIHDVDRADRAATALRAAGYAARGFVGGYEIEDIVRTAADAVSVIVDVRRAPYEAVAVA